MTLPPELPQERLMTPCNCAHMSWQPIETAPKDGTQIIAWGPYDQSVAVYAWDKCRYHKHDWIAYHKGSRVIETQDDFDTYYKTGTVLTHWQPLPEPPAAPHDTDKEKKPNG